jgi:hypothetical protein
MTTKTKAVIIIAANCVFAGLLVAAYAAKAIDEKALTIGLATLGFPSFLTGVRGLKSKPTTASKPDPSKNQLYVSRDGGTTWERRPTEKDGAS